MANEIDWSKYPRLRTWFEHRPTINVWWEEMIELAGELVAKGYAVSTPLPGAKGAL